MRLILTAELTTDRTEAEMNLHGGEFAKNMLSDLIAKTEVTWAKVSKIPADEAEHLKWWMEEGRGR